MRFERLRECDMKLPLDMIGKLRCLQHRLDVLIRLIIYLARKLLSEKFETLYTKSASKG